MRRMCSHAIEKEDGLPLERNESDRRYSERGVYVKKEALDGVLCFEWNQGWWRIQGSLREYVQSHYGEGLRRDRMKCVC